MKKKHLIAGISGVVLATTLGTAAASTAVTAPGIMVNGTNIGLSTPATATTELQKALDNTSLTINDQTFTYKELGIQYDADELNDFLSDNKAYNIDSWNSSNKQSITIDETKLREALNAKIKGLYKDPVNADVVLNDDGETWEVKKSETGKSPDVEKLKQDIEKDLTNVNTTDETKSYSIDEKTLEPTVSDKTAQDFVNTLNDMADKAGFYEGDEKKVDISKSDFAELFTVEKTDDGFNIKPVEDSIRNYAETIPEQVNKKVDDGAAVVDENGKVLKTLDPFNDGYEFNDVDGLVSRSVESLTKGDSQLLLNGKVTKAKVDEKFRRIDVDLNAREVRTYENEKLVETYKVAIGKPATPTDKGQFHVYYQTAKQDMGCSSRYDYCTKDVPWNSFFNGGEAFHGTWWHNDFGNPNGSRKSHGCVNMTINDAKEIYTFAQVGTPVHVY